MVENNCTKVGGAETLVISELANKIVQATTKVPGNKAPERNWGYLSLRGDKEDALLVVERVGGAIQPEKVLMFHTLSLEKGGRLFVHLDIGHVSSHQSRNTKKGNFGLWGGAVLCRREGLILSFSGLTEQMDEAVVLVLAIMLDWLTPDEAMEIGKFSDNKFIKPLHKLVKVCE